MNDFFGIVIAALLIMAFLAVMFVSVGGHRKDFVQYKEVHCTVADMERTTSAYCTRRYKQLSYSKKYETTMMFYLKDEKDCLYAFIVPQEIWDRYSCGSPITVEIDEYPTLNSKKYYVNGYSVRYEYDLKWDEETPIKHISEKSLQEQKEQEQSTTAVTTEMTEAVTTMQTEMTVETAE